MTHGLDSYLEISRDLSADEPCADVCGFEAFSREQYGGLLQFVRRRMANEEDARDIAQESLTRLLRYRETEPASSWKPLLYRRSEEHTSELQSLMRISYAVFCLKKKKELPDDRTI